MLLKTLVVCLFVAFALAGGDTPSADVPSSAPASSRCFVDPCSLPAPDGCVYKYCRARDHGCTAVYLDVNGREVCGSAAPSCDNVTSCNTYCPYGYKKDSNGCPECECVDRPDCTSTTCPRVSCADNERTVVPSGQCCPVCAPSCGNTQCPPVRCADGEEKFKGAYDCCATCRATDFCKNTTCPDVQCRDGEQTVDSGCCKVCVPRVDCSTVTCPALSCENGTRPAIEDDQCCPVCKADIECSQESCPALNCTAGQVVVRLEDECCPICREANYCDSVVCPAFTGNCPKDEDYHVQKNGSCCSYCPGTVCKDSERVRCDSFDRPVCAPGFYRGDNCTEAVPENERFSITIEIKVTGITLTEEDIKFFIANKLKIDPMYVTVNNIGDNTFVITVSWDRNSPPPSVTESNIEAQVNQVVASNSNFSTGKKSSASTVVAGAALAVVALAF